MVKIASSQVVAGIVTGDVALAAADMGERIDAERGVVDEHRAPDEADDEAGPAGNEETEDGEGDRRNHFVFVQPHQLGIARQIRNLGQVGLVMLREKIQPT